VAVPPPRRRAAEEIAMRTGRDRTDTRETTGNRGDQPSLSALEHSYYLMPQTSMI
jgi:hypothetical protein